jgi:putative acetyltransferase
VYQIRKETPADVTAIYTVTEAAFETPSEAQLVDRLRAAGALTLSLVADSGAELVGHVGFSPVTVTDEKGTVHEGVCLAPVSVSPKLQRQRIGTGLVEVGLDMLRDTDTPFVVVLGHPEYYPRFGFERASGYGIRWDQEYPDEALMVLALRDGGLDSVSGVVKFRPEFDGV